MTTRLNVRGANLIHNFTYDDALHPDDVNNLMEGVDRQPYAALKYVGGDGVVSGGVILSAKQVGPTSCLTDGWCGTTIDNQVIESLVNGKANNVWAVRVDVPQVGPQQYDPAYSTTFNSGALLFLARDTQPPNSFLLGTITLDGAGIVTAVDNTVLDRPTIISAAAKTWTGSATITGLAEGESLWVDVPHSAIITFAAKLRFEYTNPKPVAQGGFTVTRIENCQPGQSGFLVTNAGTSYQYYYGQTSVVIYVSITGIPA